jgi:NAD(P)-dependent dehydrogenase (short-subunit alcohol dehydrogenase family)
MASLEFDDAVAVITGAGGGIGRSLAQAFVARGTHVVITDIEGDAAETVAAELRGQGGRAIAIQSDVTQPDSVAHLVEGTLAEYGKVDVLCNNAGATLRPFRALADGALSDFTWMMDINFFGVVNGLLAFLPVMRNQPGHKHIVNTSSMSTLDEVAGHSMYVSAKSAVNGLSDVLRAEFVEKGEDIGVTVLMPGQVSTRIGTSERLRPESEKSENRHVQEYVRTAAMKRPPMPPDVVGELLMAAIESNAPYCLTHEPPADRMRERVEQQIAGFRASAKAEA